MNELIQTERFPLAMALLGGVLTWWLILRLQHSRVIHETHPGLGACAGALLFWWLAYYLLALFLIGGAVLIVLRFRRQLSHILPVLRSAIPSFRRFRQSAMGLRLKEIETKSEREMELISMLNISDDDKLDLIAQIESDRKSNLRIALNDSVNPRP